MFEDFFESWDTNKDGKVTRDEWDTLLKFMAEGKSAALAVKAGGEGDVTKSHVLWKKTKGLPQVSSGLVYRGQYVMVKDGGACHRVRLKTGKQLYLQERALPAGPYWASPVAANGYIYFTSLADGAVTGPESRGRQAGSRRPEPGTRRAAGGDAGNRRQHFVHSHREAPVCVLGEKMSARRLEGPFFEQQMGVRKGFPRI